MTPKTISIVKSRREFRAKLFRFFLAKNLNKFARDQADRGVPRLACFSQDFISIDIFLNGFYEREDLDLTKRYLQERFPVALSGTFVDVGANIGNHSLYFSRYVKRVLSIEPNPRTFKVLEVNAAMFGGTCLNLGIGDASGVLTLSVPSAVNSGRASFKSDSGDNSSKKIEKHSVQVKTLDDVLSVVSDVSLIKVDVEGMEAEVFAGAEAVLRRQRPVVLFEQGRRDFSQGQSRAINLLKKYGYEFSAIQRSPSAQGGNYLSFFWIKALLGRLFVGERLEVVDVDYFRSDAYSMIIATPEKGQK
ncbi:MAG: FkbM family methyltransferase [Maritimibacter sp.]|uniref:FkbM family methyltransferase n=1 Tax=Maritimibacter sp. TaxID=2003363 RepID=UPI001DADE0FF|nr:FkbM family methyltransferase [Maritimibacter sp.]MBL6427645.1 FkbM family methyltransferase [Maritimibacter sp.]